MSRKNITSIVPAGLGKIRVTFMCKDGEERTYEYDGIDAIQFAAGADPAHLQGERVDGNASGGEVMSAIELAQAIARMVSAL